MNVTITLELEENVARAILEREAIIADVAARCRDASEVLAILSEGRAVRGIDGMRACVIQKQQARQWSAVSSVLVEAARKAVVDVPENPGPRDGLPNGSIPVRPGK